MSAFGEIVLKKSFRGDDRNFLGLLMRFARGDVRGHNAFYKNCHRPPYRRQGALQRPRPLKIEFREILEAVRFSTFSTISGTKQTSHFKGVRTVFDPNWPHSGGRLTASGYANLSVLREGASGGGTSLARRNTHRVRLYDRFTGGSLLGCGPCPCPRWPGTRPRPL